MHISIPLCKTEIESRSARFVRNKESRRLADPFVGVSCRWLIPARGDFRRRPVNSFALSKSLFRGQTDRATLRVWNKERIGNCTTYIRRFPFDTFADLNFDVDCGESQEILMAKCDYCGSTIILVVSGMPTGASVIRSVRDAEACSRSLVRFPKRLSGNRSGNPIKDNVRSATAQDL